MRCTTIKQSEHLLELGLDSSTADFQYVNGESENLHFNTEEHDEDYIPCWSTEALMKILAEKALEFDDDGSVSLHSWSGTWSLNMYDCPLECTEDYKEPIDACYEMIVKVLLWKEKH